WMGSEDQRSARSTMKALKSTVAAVACKGVKVEIMTIDNVGQVSSSANASAPASAQAAVPSRPAPTSTTAELNGASAASTRATPNGAHHRSISPSLPEAPHADTETPSHDSASGS